jgi:hypothetical protein
MNNVTNDFQQEVANRKGGDRVGFVGTYISRWNDNSGSITANLTVAPNGNSQFLLNWTRLQSALTGNISTTYTSIGTVINNQLVCSYVMINRR